MEDKGQDYDFVVINASGKELPIGATLKVVAQFMFGKNRYALKEVSRRTAKHRKHK